MTNPTVSSLVSQLNHGLVPSVSKSKYDKAWNNYETWLKKQDNTSVCGETIQAYAVYLDSSSYAPTTIRSVVSMLKKKSVSLGYHIEGNVWQKLKWWLDQISKNYKPKQSEPFSQQEIFSSKKSLDNTDNQPRRV